MKIAMSVGHGKYIRGASGYLDEVNEAVKVVERVEALWLEAGVGVETFFDTTSTSQNENLNRIVNWHNSRSPDLNVSVHFNAYATTSKPMGHETLYVTQQSLATKIAAGVAGAGGFLNRGAKKRTDLYFLNNTREAAVLLEVCFVDSSADADLYRRNFEAICVAIAETIGNVTIGGEPPEIERPPIAPPLPEEENRVEITAVTTGNVIIDLNGQEFVHGRPDTDNRLLLTLKIEGEVTVTINGQDYHNEEAEPPPPIPDNQRNIICTVFGGVSDPNNSAYPPYDFITDAERSVALPYKFPEPRPKVRVFNTENELSVVCEIRDVGPWYTDDPYWETGTRPRAEPAGSTIRGGPNNGRTSNGAGIDLTPAAARAIGLEGKGTVSWHFEDQLVA